MVKKGWVTTTIEDVCVKITDGSHWSPKSVDEGYYMASVKDMLDYGFDLSSCRKISKEDFDKLVKNDCKPLNNDVLIAKDGSYLKHIFVWNKEQNLVILSSIAILRPNLKKIYPYYLSKYLSSPYIKKGMKGYVTGAALPRIILKDFKRFKIEIPKDIELQKKIATILSNYDNLVENNEKRIKLLERIAKRIYEEWFVNFKFPGHEDVKMMDSKTDFGKIPEGWEVGNVEEIASIQRGVSYKSSELAEEESIPFVNLKCMLPGGEGGFRSSGLKRYNGKYKEVQKLIPGDIVMGITEMTQKREIIARPARIPEMNEKEITFSMDLVKIIPKESISKDWLYSFFKYSSFGIEVKEFANGVNVLHLNPQHIINYKMVIPSKDIMEKFINSISKLFILNDNLQLKNQNLLKTRDLLLPRLISGEMDVSELNIKLPEIEV